MAACCRVGREGRGPKPLVVVEPFGHRFRPGVRRGAVADLEAAGEADHHLPERAERAVPHPFAGIANPRVRPPLGSGLHDASIAFGGPHDGASFGHRVGEGLLAVDVLAGAHRRDREQRVGMVGRGDHRGVQVVPRQQFAVVAIGLADARLALFGVELVHRLAGRLGAGVVHVADGQHLHSRVVEEGVQIAAPLSAQTNAGHRDAAARCRVLAPGREEEEPRAGRCPRRGSAVVSCWSSRGPRSACRLLAPSTLHAAPSPRNTRSCCWEVRRPLAPRPGRQGGACGARGEVGGTAKPNHCQGVAAMGEAVRCSFANFSRRSPGN